MVGKNINSTSWVKITQHVFCPIFTQITQVGLFLISAVKQLITSKIKGFIYIIYVCVCVCTVYIYYVYIHTLTYSIYFGNIYMHIHLYECI